MIVNIVITKDQANYPVVTVNGYSVDMYGRPSQVCELINELFDIDVRNTDVFNSDAYTLKVQDTRVPVEYGNMFTFKPTSTGEEIAAEIVRRLTIIKEAVAKARSVSYSYSKTVIL